jgi:DNA-binding response OmpR family regulator
MVPRPPDATHPHAPTPGLRILIADDDHDCRDSLEDAIRSFGYSCATARDGAEAWDMYVADRADLILADWKMPCVDGLQLCLRVRADDAERPYTQFVFVSADADEAHILTGMRAGADDYLVKPLDLGKLEARLVIAERAVKLRR